MIIFTTMATNNLRRAARTTILVDAEHFTTDEIQVDHTINILSNHYNHFLENCKALVGESSLNKLETPDHLLALLKATYGSVVIKLQHYVRGIHTGSISTRALLNRASVKLPTFNGKLEIWLMFKGIFESMVHNRTDFDSTYNLSRLRQCLDAQAVPKLPLLSQEIARYIIDMVRCTLRTLTVMGLPTDIWDAIIYPIVLRKLPSPAIAHWF